MKNIRHFIAVFVWLTTISVYGQTEKDSIVIDFIKEQKEFVGLNELGSIPDSIIPYLDSVKDYMKMNKMNPDDYWIWTSYIQEDSNSVFIPLCHYDGFEFKKNLEEQNKEANKDRKEGDLITVIDFNGNASGKDGHLQIEKSTKKVLSFRLWQ